MDMTGCTSGDIDAVKASGLFDPEWYADTYPDVRLVGLSPLEHYLWIGGRLGRSPSPAFDARNYLARNPDVAESGTNPLLHYLKHGLREGREAFPHFSDPPPWDGEASASSEADIGSRPSVNWVMNADNHGWAYGNNAHQLAAFLPGFRHVFDADAGLSDIALYFDIKIFKMRGVLGRKNVLRVGGPRPIALTYGDDTERLREDIAAFDAIIVLNRALYNLFAPLHENVHLVPNALDLDIWQPAAAAPRGEFTVGFAGNLGTRKEREIKGFDLVEEACARIGARLVHFSKGADQIPREEMRSRFYGEIDCLVHPVAEGKEGCSNVIMEALALGVPVVTTPHAGFHAEQVPEGGGILYCPRDADAIAARIESLRGDPALRQNMSRRARAFALEAHDVRRIAPKYRDVFLPLLGLERRLKVAFVPFWEPVQDFASARLRCAAPVRLLEDNPLVTAKIGFDASADVVFVSQLASDATYEALMARPDIFVVYDLCDRYFADERMVGGVHAKTRFFEMAARADVLIASTVELKRELARLGLGKPVVYLPDGIDYAGMIDPAVTPPGGPLVWYGNPGRGNFDSARWMIDYALDKTERGVRILSSRRHFARLAREDASGRAARYLDACTDWRYESFVADLRESSTCLLSHSAEERTKSPNRLVTAVANGVPAIVSGAPSCERILRAAGMDFAIVKDEAGLAAAIARLDVPNERARYLAEVQKAVKARFGDAVLAARYGSFLKQHVHDKHRADGRPLRVLFISHNLSVGEGAPTSLFQTVCGLRDTYGIEPVVYAVLPGGLEESYEARGIPVILADFEARSRLVSKTLARAYPEAKRAFRRIVEEREIDVVIANTAKCLCFIDMANEIGVPAFSIIRESSAEHVDMNFSQGEMMDASRRALRAANPIVFVSDKTRALWLKAHALERTSLIPNGIDLSAFEEMRNAPRAGLRAALGLPADDIVLLTVGTINERKSQIDIVNAFARLPQALWSRAQLVLVGAKPSSYLEKIMRHIADLPSGIAGRIHIVSETHEIAPWYRASDIFVFASTNESYPRVIVEAMYFGLPIVSAAVFGTEEQIVHGESGLLFKPRDVAALADCLTRVMSDGDMRRSLAEGAEGRFVELTSYPEMLHRYYALIRNMTAENAGLRLRGDRG